MIKGTPKKSYNAFEEELNQLIGSYYESYGLEYYYHQLHDTFSKSEAAIVKYADDYLNKFNKEDDEVKDSIERYDPEHLLKSTPLVDTLRKSYFITAHSEFESIWKEVITIYNTHFTSSQKPIISLNDKYLIHSSFCATNLLDKVVSNHQVLISYNYIRNKIVHQKAVTTSPEYQTMLTQIQSGKIRHLRTEVDGTNAQFFIEDIQFVNDYTGYIIGFLTDIVETSYNDRQHGQPT